MTIDDRLDAVVGRHGPDRALFTALEQRPRITPLVGTQNRERRRMKQSKRRRQQRDRASWQGVHPGARGWGDTGGTDEMADGLILAAAHACCGSLGDGRQLQSLIDTLAQGLGLERGRERWVSRLAPCCRVAVHRCSTPAGQPMRSSAVSSDDGPNATAACQSWRARLVRSWPVGLPSDGPESPHLGEPRMCGSRPCALRAGKPTLDRHRRPLRHRSPPGPP